MKSLARETRSGMTANAIALGLIETAHDPAFIEANREKLTKFYPLRRLGTPADVAPMVVLWHPMQAVGLQVRLLVLAVDLA